MANEEMTINPEWLHRTQQGTTEGMEESTQEFVGSTIRETGGNPNEILQNESRQFMTEQLVMNDFIKTNIGIEFDGRDMINSKYIQSDKNTQRLYADTAFEIFNVAYIKDSEENERIKNLPFQDYVKIYNPAPDFHNYLRSPQASKESPAWFFHDIFNADMGSFRLAVLDSYQRKIEEMSSE